MAFTFHVLFMGFEMIFTTKKLDKFLERQILLILFKNVANTEEIKKMAIEGKLEGSFVNASLIVDSFQVLVAVNQAVRSQINQSMKTRSIYSEILYNLSPTKNITESLRSFGISEKSTSLLAVILEPTNESLVNKITEMVKGETVPLEELASLYNENQIKKTYKIEDKELQNGSLLNSVVTRIATKDIIN